MSMNESTVPEGFLRVSDAVGLLAAGMWGGLPRPAPVQAIKRKFKKLSVGFGPWREQAGQCLRSAAVKGKLPIYVAAEHQVAPSAPAAAPSSSGTTNPIAVCASVVRQLVTRRGSLPDHPIRPSVKTVAGDMRLLNLLTFGVLLVRASEFARWYRSERAKGKWRSQRSRSTAAVGRPAKQSDRMRNAIIALVRDGKWSAEGGIAKLQRLLCASGRYDVPSPDTLARVVDELHQETGEPEYFRPKRSRRKRDTAKSHSDL
jgi:hypothetical protein